MHILSANHPQIQTGKTQQSKPLHQTLKVGDILKAEIIDQLQKQLTVLLADGTEVEAQLDKILDFHIGQEVKLEVKEINGKQVLMKVNVETPEGKQSSENVATKKILTQLDMVPTQESDQAIKVLMQKMLPITKENIRQVEFGLKTSQLPVKTLLFMLENNIPVTKATVTQMEAYENGDIKLQGQLEAMVKEILLTDDIEQLETVHTILSEAKGKSTPKLTGENIETIDSNQLFSKGEEAASPTEPLELNEMKVLNQPRNVEILKKEILEFAKDLFFVRPEQLKNDTDVKLKDTNKLYQVIYEVVDSLEKTKEEISPSSNKENDIFSDIKSNIEFLNVASKYDTMIHIPLMIQNQFKHGELYIFNQKKQSKKGYHEASMLISLETVSLGTVGAYIKKYNKQISCEFKTDDIDFENIIKDHISGLKSNLKGKGYDLVAVTYIPSSETFDVDEDVPGKAYDKPYRFDTKV